MLSSILKNLAIPLFLILCIPLLLGYLIGWGDVFGTTILFIFLVGVPLLFIYYGLKSPVKLLIINIFISVPCIIVAGLFAYRQTYFQIPSMALMYYAIVMVVIGVIGAFVFLFGRDETMLKSLLPLGFSILTLALTYSSMSVGYNLSLYFFRKRLPKYEKLVEMIKDGKLQASEHNRIETLPDGYKHLAHYILVRKSDDDVTQIFFSWVIGFPCMHTDYMYCSDEKTPKEIYGAYKVADNWYRVNY